MKKLYSIGETAKIMGITVQALRNYSNMNMVQPEYIDKDTGYRYYSFNQFYDIDRIVYLRNMGMSLAEIAAALHSRNIETVVSALTRREAAYNQQIKDIQQRIQEIQWYRGHFQYAKEERLKNIPYIKQIPKRYILWGDYCHDREITEKNIIEERNRRKYRYHRQWGFICDSQAWMENRFEAVKEFTILNETFGAKLPPSVMALPQGSYMCIWTPRDRIQSSLVKTEFQNRSMPSYVISLLYEENLLKYDNCPYEFQLLI
jgi:DNA-binding transcriptional MerR regulator